MDFGASHADFVDKYYQMDPTQEIIIPNGTQLRNGMVVLIEHERFRIDASDLAGNPGMTYHAMKSNRWCVIQEIELHYFSPNMSPTDVSFTAIYADNTMFRRTYSIKNAWLAKIESLVQMGEWDETKRERTKPAADDPDWQPAQDNVQKVLKKVNEEVNPPDEIPHWVQSIEDKWREEKGTSTTGE